MISSTAPKKTTSTGLTASIAALGTTQRWTKMSDYVFEFGVSTNRIGSDVTEEVDLIDDGWFAEEDLEGKSDDEIQSLLNGALEDFVWNNIESWVKRV